MTGPQTCYNLVPTSKNQVAKRASIEGNGIFITTPAATLTFVSVFAPSLPGIYTNINLQKTTKLTLKLFI